MVRQEILNKQKARQLRKQQRLKQQRQQERRIRKAEAAAKIKPVEAPPPPPAVPVPPPLPVVVKPVRIAEHNLDKEQWYKGDAFKALKDWQVAIANRRHTDREKRRSYSMALRKQRIVEKYGTEPTICYFYYLWNAVDYAGEETVRASFKSIAGQGDEIIVADYSSTDGTPEIAKEYGIKVVNVEKTEGVLFHMSKLVNKVLVETKCNFIVDLSIHTVYPKDFHNSIKYLVQNIDVKEKQLAVRGLMDKGKRLVRRHAAALCMYRPFLSEARGYDERTYYGFGTTPYVLDLLLTIWELEWEDHPLDFIHKAHNHFKMPLLKGLHGFGDNMNLAHAKALEVAETLIDKLVYNFDEGVKTVQNSYTAPKVFGIGLSRTGTVSLTHALNILGYKSIHAPRPFFGPGLIDTMKDWDAGTDSQIAFAYKELDKAFPNSKFILTIRDLEGWLKSFETYLGTQKSRFQPFDPEWWEEFQLKFFGDVYFNKKKYTEVFIKHYKETIEYFFNNENFIIMNLERGEGWNKLCTFLKKPIPDTPFPHLNKSKLKNKKLYRKKHLPKVFGIGLARTGTTSLTSALESFGYEIIHDNVTMLKPSMEEIIEEVSSYNGAVDNPVSLLYKKLDKAFPGSKFILTTRTLKSWLRSIEFLLSLEENPIKGLNKDLRKSLYGDSVFNKKTYRKAFIKHHWEVMDYFKNRNDLLIMDMSKGDSWDKLCDFLFKPFPHKFTTKEIIKGLLK